MPKNLRVTRTRNRAYPYAWTCTIPDPTSHTGECGISSFAAMDHAIHDISVLDKIVDATREVQ